MFEELHTHKFWASRAAFARRVHQALFPNKMPERDARQNAHEALREALGKTLDAIKSERIAKWKSHMIKGAKGLGELAFKWMRGYTTMPCSLL